jgi:hypothetical protein
MESTLGPSLPTPLLALIMLSSSVPLPILPTAASSRSSLVQVALALPTLHPLAPLPALLLALRLEALLPLALRHLVLDLLLLAVLLLLALPALHLPAPPNLVPMLSRLVSLVLVSLPVLLPSSSKGLGDFHNEQPVQSFSFT